MAEKRQARKHNKPTQKPNRKTSNRLEEAMTRLTNEMAQLAEGQRQLQEVTARLVERQQRLEEGQQQLRETVAELAEGQRQLRETVAHSLERQQRLEELTAQLAEGQRQLQAAVAELMVANKRMGRLLAQLTERVGRIEQQWGLSVEAVAQVMLPPYLEKKKGIKLRGEPGEELQPLYLPVNKEWAQIDLYGEGTMNGEEVCVICECKSRVYGREVKTFARKLERIGAHLKTEKRIVPVLFGFFVHPSAAPVAASHQIILVGALQR